jgi:hypothetical protein
MHDCIPRRTVLEYARSKTKSTLPTYIYNTIILVHVQKIKSRYNMQKLKNSILFT